MNAFFQSMHNLPDLLIIGFIIVTAFYLGRTVRFIRLPSLIGFMFLGVLLGPSLLNILGESQQEQLHFITEIALGFVALSIGLELKLSSLKELGKGMAAIIIAESFGAFILVTALVYLVTHNLPMALIFGGIAPASAPAGTVAVIQEYKAKGSLTKALYAVVGFDDGLGIIIFGFAAAIAKNLLHQQTGGAGASFAVMMWEPLKEVMLSVAVGMLLAFFFSLLAKRLKHSGDVSILLIGTTLIAIGLSTFLHLSLILTNMIIGMVVVNTQPYDLLQKIMSAFLPLCRCFSSSSLRWPAQTCTSGHFRPWDCWDWCIYCPGPAASSWDHASEHCSGAYKKNPQLDRARDTVPGRRCDRTFPYCQAGIQRARQGRGKRSDQRGYYRYGGHHHHYRHLPFL
ncbi:MAG: cation:proton antiporter [Candidatus Marinimicrobia bacterium]|nr:cation:proton antiporter [Candidatus Neomarinimicrobiota bacterium]